MRTGPERPMETLRLSATALSNGEAWADFYRASRGALTTYALSLVGDPAAAQDLIQDVLVRMVERKRSVADARPYVMRCLRNLAIDRRRRRKDRSQDVSLDGDGLAFVDVDGVADRESLDLVRAALRGLGAAHREIIVLRIYAELPFREIAEILGQPLGTVTSYFNRGLNELRRLLHVEPRHAG